MSTTSESTDETNRTEFTAQHTGEQDVYDHDASDFDTREVVEVRCNSMDDAREVGQVVSLLNEFDADTIVDRVRGYDDEDGVEV